MHNNKIGKLFKHKILNENKNIKIYNIILNKNMYKLEH